MTIELAKVGTRDLPKATEYDLFKMYLVGSSDLILKRYLKATINYLFMKYVISVLLITFCAITLSAQRPEGSGLGSAPIARVYGKLLDSATDEAIPYASVVLKPMKKDSIVGGALTGQNGFFDIKGLMPGMYQLKISFIGFADTSIQVKLFPPNIETDAGNIRLRNMTQTLGQVTITGEKSAVEFGVDRRSYSVDRNLAATGGTAIDALKNIPSVSVDVEGNVELRNSAPQIFVDGKPSPLTLDQIPSSEIDKVEVITNPSAKYAASSAGGIINIVLKKSKMPGIFGTLNLGAGTNDRYNGMASINIRQSPLGVNLSYNFNTGQNPGKAYNIIDRYQSGNFISNYTQTGTNTSKRQMQFVRLGLDYDINARNTISLSGNANLFNMRFGDDQYIQSTFAGNITDYTGTRVAVNKRAMRNFTPQLDYRRTFPKAGKEWTSFVQYSLGDGTGDSDIRQDYVYSSGSVARELIQSTGTNNGNTLHAQTDFTNPIGENKKIELGARFQYKYNTSATDAFRSDSTGELVFFPLLSLKYNYDEIISAAYANYIARKGKLGYQLGLRAETSNFTGRIPDTDSTFSYQIPNGIDKVQNMFFPSVFLTYTLKEGQDLQFNLSRKLERPNFFQLMPFVWQQDNQSYRAGNPNLQPEFRYIGEVNYALTQKWGTFFSSVYGRYEDQPVTSVVKRSTDGTESLINTFINGDNNIRFGFEENVKYKIIKSLDITGGIDVFRNQIKATFNGTDLTNSGWNYSVDGGIDWKFLKNWVVQITSEYEGTRILPQGHTTPNYSTDFSIKRNFNPLGSITFQVRDVFNTGGRGQIFETETYTQNIYRRREVRFFQLSAQMRFGKPDATIFKKMKGQTRPSSGGDMDF